MKGNKKILFTTVYRDNERYDIYRIQTRDNLATALTQVRNMHPGLRFIKQNIPQIDILEFPTWEEFIQVISSGWDIVGFSFYTTETNKIQQMADYVRKAGVNELWAGNYGVLNPSTASTFDKVFTGYSEDKIAQELGVEIEELKHPPLTDYMGVKPLGNTLFLYGWIFSSRGCPLECTFCQTPAFANKKVVKTPIGSIESLLRYYTESGVQQLFIYDENFGSAPKHAREVVSLLGKYKIPWGVMTRADVLKKNFDEWYENGLSGAKIGIESLDPETLKDIRKREEKEDYMEVLELLNSHNCFSIGTYMIGFEQDTVDSVKNYFQQISELKPDFMNLFIVTPYHQTTLWDQIQQKYEIDTSDWSKFDGKHLVWNHPQLAPEDAQMLLEYGYDLFNSEGMVFRMLTKLAHHRKDQMGISGVHNLLLSSLHNRFHSRSIESPYFFE